jgi:uncharacterized membrane protein
MPSNRLRERGETPSWKAVIGAIYSQSGKEISWMPLAVLFIIWMYQVRLLITPFFGSHGMPPEAFPAVLFTTPEGPAFPVVVLPILGHTTWHLYRKLMT